MSDKVKLAGLIVLAGFAYAVYELFIFYTESVPGMEADRQALEAQFNAKQQEYQRLRNFVTNIESIKAEYRELSIQLKSALDYMPPDFKLSELLRRLTLLAQNSGVELINFTPDLMESRAEGAFYSTMNIKFEIRGGFTQCLLYFDQISRLKRIINLTEVTMAPQNDGGTGTVRTSRISSTVVRVGGNLVTYRFAE